MDLPSAWPQPAPLSTFLFLLLNEWDQLVRVARVSRRAGAKGAAAVEANRGRAAEAR